MMAHLRPRVLLAEKVSVEVGHLPVSLVCEAPHQLPVTHVVKLFPLLLSLTTLLETSDSLETYINTENLSFYAYSFLVVLICSD